MSRCGNVYVQKKLAGVITEDEQGYTFQYDDAYLETEGAVAVSLTLPLQREEYQSNVLFPFFDGLIPEGWLLGVVERNWKIDNKDRFGLLLASCKDCIGDVYVEVAE
ncbi:MAG: phosphatidylinositol kinase [Butyrivibrio sp.]|nr:phosphatidylinositol kinase [Butyrivibrio sp.]